MCAAWSCVQTMVWLPMQGIFCTDANVYGFQLVANSDLQQSSEKAAFCLVSGLTLSRDCSWRETVPKMQNCWQQKGLRESGQYTRTWLCNHRPIISMALTLRMSLRPRSRVLHAAVRHRPVHVM